jgi:hypothetical protein
MKSRVAQNIYQSLITKNTKINGNTWGNLVYWRHLFPQIIQPFVSTNAIRISSYWVISLPKGYFMSAMLWEKVLVTAKEFLEDKNINDSREFREPMYQTKLMQFGWDMQFTASSIFVELIWQIAIGRETISERQRLDRLFCPSPIATHANFRGCKEYRTGNLPEKGAIAIWGRGQSWQGHMAIVSDVSENKQMFDVIEGRVLTGSGGYFIQVKESKGKLTDQPYSRDKLNLKGFIYPPNREIL